MVSANLTRVIALQRFVFAHIVMENTAAHTVKTWNRDIALANAAKIDAFALNIAPLDPNTHGQVANAFTAAEASAQPFKLFFSFDYVGGGQWPATGDNSVTSYLKQFKDRKSYFHYEGKPFVSTFEGIENTQDWEPGGLIRSAVGDIYFIPDWSSLGPSGIKTQHDKIQGVFNWSAWPDGASNMSTKSDEQWQDSLADRSYMMSVSPWFFRSSDGGKNWIWKGDDLWAQRWAQIERLQPPFVQIISWNDYGESHYIGPVHDLSEIPASSIPYVNGMPHDGWRASIPYFAAMYRRRPFQIADDQVQYWYRNSHVHGGGDCGVVGNNAGHAQIEMPPSDLAEDRVFINALLSAPAEIHLKIGSHPVTKFSGIKGLNLWSQAFNGQTGEINLSVIRAGAMVKTGRGSPIWAHTHLANGCTNYNAWVGSL